MTSSVNSRGTKLFLATLLGILAAGCGGIPLATPELVHNFQPTDIPVPYSFRIDEDESWAYIKFMDEPLALRSCKLVYWGDRPATEVANWYDQQMPLHGWNRSGGDRQNGIRLLFTKGDEESEIVLKRTVDDKGEFYITRLTARIGVR